MRWEINGRKLRPLDGYAMFSDGDSIFSHGRHFEIARYVDSTPRKDCTRRVASRVVLYTMHGYSVSTAKHKSIVRRAIPSHVPVFVVDDTKASTKEEHAANIASFEKRAADAYARALRARTNGPWLIESAEQLMTNAEDYAATFGLRYTRPDLGELGDKLAKAAAKQAKAAAKAKADREKAEAQRREAQRLADSDDFHAWLRGEKGAYCPASYRTTPEGGAYLRRYAGIVRDPRSQARDNSRVDELQTSQGAAVPWDHALRAFRFVKLVRERGEGWKRNGQTIRVGVYMLDSIDPDGSFVAGCHRINWAEIEQLAIKEGVYDAAPSAEAVTLSEGH